jgi:hypothetical protein
MTRYLDDSIGPILDVLRCFDTLVRVAQCKEPLRGAGGREYAAAEAEWWQRCRGYIGGVGYVERLRMERV